MRSSHRTPLTLIPAHRFIYRRVTDEIKNWIRPTISYYSTWATGYSQQLPLLCLWLDRIDLIYRGLNGPKRYRGHLNPIGHNCPCTMSMSSRLLYSIPKCLLWVVRFFSMGYSGNLPLNWCYQPMSFFTRSKTRRHIHSHHFQEVFNTNRDCRT